MLSVTGLILAFLTIILLLKYKVNLGMAMVIGGIMVGITSGLGLTTVTLLWEGLIDKSTLELLAIVVMIGILGYIMKETGSLKKMLDSLLALINNPKVLLMSAPGLISLLSVPGGAIISAPMVDEIGNKLDLSPENKTSINIIYRHIWYMCYPLYQTLILASNLSGYDKLSIIAYNFPAMMAGIAASYYINFKNVSGNFGINKKRDLKDIMKLVKSLLPLILVLVLSLVFKIHFIPALAVGILTALLNEPAQDNKRDFVQFFSTGWNRAKTMIIPGINRGLIYSVAGIMMFRRVVEESGSIPVFSDFLLRMGIPLWLLVFIIPFMASFATGLNLASVGLTIPIFLHLLPGGTAGLGYIGLLFVSSKMGYLISPMHLCIALTKEYFKADIAGVYRELIIPMIVITITALVTTFVLI